MNTPDDGNIDIDDLVSADRVEDVSADEEAEASGSDVEAASAADADTDNENLNDDAVSDEDSVEGDDPDADEEEDVDGDEEDVDSDETKAKRNPQVERRIAKEVSKRKALESELSTVSEEVTVLRDRLAELEGTNGRVFSNPVEIRERRSSLLEEIDEIEDAIDDGGYTTKDGVEIDKKTLKRWRRDARRELDEALPAAERRIEKQREINRRDVAKVYPHLLNESTVEAKEASAFLNRHPTLKADPEAFLIIGDLLRGRKLRLKISENGKSAANTQQRKPPEGRSTSQATRSVRPRERKNEDRSLLDAIAEVRV